MHSTSYLYGVEPDKFINLPYKKALQFKAKASKELFDKLYLTVPFIEQDHERVDAVYKAQKHTRGLLAEITPGYIA